MSHRCGHLNVSRRRGGQRGFCKNLVANDTGYRFCGQAPRKKHRDGLLEELWQMADDSRVSGRLHRAVQEQARGARDSRAALESSRQLGPRFDPRREGRACEALRRKVDDERGVAAGCRAVKPERRSARKTTGGPGHARRCACANNSQKKLSSCSTSPSEPSEPLTTPCPLHSSGSCHLPCGGSSPKVREAHHRCGWSRHSYSRRADPAVLWSISMCSRRPGRPAGLPLPPATRQVREYGQDKEEVQAVVKPGFRSLAFRPDEGAI